MSESYDIHKEKKWKWNNMQDAIDKRNERDRIAHSIVKRWNVHYMSEEEILAARRKQQDEQRAQEILDRLARVAAEEEEKKQREIDAAVRQQIEEERARLQKEEADETISDDKLSAILGEKSPERKETPQAAEVSQEVETPQVVEKQTDSGEQVPEVIEATVETEQE
jgi:hypothetical protein